MMTACKSTNQCGNCVWRSNSAKQHAFCHAAFPDGGKITSHVFSKGDVLLEENKAVNGFYCIQKGIVRVITDAGEFKNLFLWHSMPGDVIGIESYITKENLAYSAYAADKVRACFVSPLSEAGNEGSEHPKTLFNLLQIICGLISKLERGQGRS